VAVVGHGVQQICGGQLLEHLCIIGGGHLGLAGGVAGRYGLFFEKTILEKQYYDEAYGNAGISNIKHGAEEDEMLAAPHRYPAGKIAFKQWEIQHIYHLAMQKAGISTAFRQKLCHITGIEIAVFEQHTVKHGVNQIAEGAGENEPDAHNEAWVFLLFDNVKDVIHPKHHCYHPKHAEGHFAPATAFAKLPAPGHALIFYKVQLEPLPQYVVLLTQVVGGFDVKLERLVEYQNSQYDKKDGPFFHTRVFERQMAAKIA
jgi:hypothetical protein